MQTIIIGTFLRDEASVSNYSLAMADEFVKLGYKVIVITVERKINLVNTKTNPMILTWPSYGASKLVDFLFIVKLIKKYDVKMLIGNFSAVNYFMIAGKILNVPHRIAWIHTMSDQMVDVAKWKFFRKKYIYKFATKIIANSNATKDDAIKTFTLEKKKVDVFPNLLKNNDLFISKNKQFKIVFIGRFHYSKGIDILIRAMNVLVKDFPNIRLEIIAGGDSSKCVELANKYNLENNIVFLGKLPMKEVLLHLSTSQFSVVPSREEAFGYTVIESFSVKIPVIGSDTGGIKEIIEDTKSGFLFPVGDYMKLAEIMSYCLNNKTVLQTMSNNAYNRFKSKYLLTDNIKQVVSVLDESIKLTKN
jgi:glycosyltransferase involved in cell wall biosynthesis